MYTDLIVISTNITDPEYRIINASAVPPVGSTMTTPDGTRKVHSHHYDFNTSGNCRITMVVSKL